MMTDAELAECWAREELLNAIYRVTWRTGEEMPVESARMIGTTTLRPGWASECGRRPG